MAYPLRTPRLTLRFPRESDVEPLVAYRNDPAVAALQDWDLPYDVAQARALVAAHEGRTDLVPGRGHQVMIDLDGELLGDLYVGLHEHGGIADIGFSLVPSAQGRGIATEAASAVIDDLVERLGVHRIVAELSQDNLPSARLLERLGMTFEALTRRSFWWRGVWDDNVYYSMTGDEWRAWRDRPRTPPGDVRLVEITEHNRRLYERVRVHRSQERFVASVQESYADAFFGADRPRLLGIEADGEPVGFLMYAEPGPILWRVLVDRRHQRRGIGRRALAQWLDAMRTAGHAEVETSWVQGPGGPEPWCRAMGFMPTGEADGETRARLVL